MVGIRGGQVGGIKRGSSLGERASSVRRTQVCPVVSPRDTSMIQPDSSRRSFSSARKRSEVVLRWAGPLAR